MCVGNRITDKFIIELIIYLFVIRTKAQIFNNGKFLITYSVSKYEALILKRSENAFKNIERKSRIFHISIRL